MQLPEDLTASWGSDCQVPGDLMPFASFGTSIHVYIDTHTYNE